MIEKITNIKKVKTDSKRYDITVADTHNFYANDILVHNCQNLKNTIFSHYEKGTSFEVTYKLDGSSMTVGRYEKQGELIDTICSRNLALKLDNEVDTSQFLITGKPVLAKLIEAGQENMGVQGELVSPNIQKNFEGVTKPAYYVYNVWSVKDFAFYKPADARKKVLELGLNYVPVMHESITLKDLFGDVVDANDLLQKLLAYADGPSGLNGKYREGLVYKSEDGGFSFKTISNKYLIKEA